MIKIDFKVHNYMRLVMVFQKVLRIKLSIAKVLVTK